MDKESKDNLNPAQSADEQKEAASRSFEGKYRSERPSQPAPEDEAYIDEEALPVQESAARDDDEELDNVVIPTPLDKKPVRKKKKRRMKSLPLIITSLIFVALFLGYSAMVWLIPAIENKVEETPINYRYLVKYSTDQISAIDFKFRDGYEYKLKLSRYLNESGYMTTYYSVENKSEFIYNQTVYGNMVMQIVDIASGTVASEKADLATYGLDDPKVSVTYYILNADGGVDEGITLHIGNAAPVGNGHYAMLDGEDTVYVIGYSDADYLVEKDYHYRDLLLLTISDYINDIDMVSFKRGENELQVARASVEEKNSLEYATTYRIYEPALLNCNTVYLEEKVLSHMQGFTALSVVEDYPEDLSVYGLAPENEPLEITIRQLPEDEESEPKTTKFTLSVTPNEDGSVYGKVSGITSIFTFDPSLFDFADVTYDQLFDMTIWTYPISNVERVEFDLDGEKYTLDLEQSADAITKAAVNGTEIDERDARMLYSRILQIYLDDIIMTDEEGAKISYSFTIYGKDGAVRSLELAEISERRFQVVLDGVRQDYYVRYNALKYVKDAFTQLAEGLHLEYAV